MFSSMFILILDTHVQNYNNSPFPGISEDIFSKCLTKFTIPERLTTQTGNQRFQHTTVKRSKTSWRLEDIDNLFFS